MAFGLGCFSCCQGCVPCNAACDTTPGEAFNVVYQVEDSRANLTWTGDAMGPIDGPWPGFEGGTVFSQTITSNGIALPGTRFPCFFRLKLWRNVGGGDGSESLTSQWVRVSCVQGKLDFGFLVLNAGESVEFTPNPENASELSTYVVESTLITLDGNAGDRHAFPPLSLGIAGSALCADTIVSVQARIEWTNSLIQHNLYGQFVECYDEINLPPESPGDCLDCDGTPAPAPETVYLTISNFDRGGMYQLDGIGGGLINNTELPSQDGEYALSLVPPLAGSCSRHSMSLSMGIFNGGWTSGLVQAYTEGGRFETFGGVVTDRYPGYLFLKINGAVFASVLPPNHPVYPNADSYAPAEVNVMVGGIDAEQYNDMLCGGPPVTGSVVAQASSYFGLDPAFVSFDWELST